MQTKTTPSGVDYKVFGQTTRAISFVWENGVLLGYTRRPRKHVPQPKLLVQATVSKETLAETKYWIEVGLGLIPTPTPEVVASLKALKWGVGWYQPQWGKTPLAGSEVGGDIVFKSPLIKSDPVAVVRSCGLSQSEVESHFDAIRGFNTTEWQQKVQIAQQQRAVWKKMATSSVRTKWYGSHSTLKSSDGKLLDTSNLGEFQDMEGLSGEFEVVGWNGGVGFGSHDTVDTFKGTLGGVSITKKWREADGIRPEFSYHEVKMWYADEGRVRSALARAGLPIEPMYLYPHNPRGRFGDR